MSREPREAGALAPSALARAISRVLRGSSRAEVDALVPDLATGLRAALATVVPLTLSAQVARPGLAWTALGGWLGTLADPGGSRGFRGRVLLAFAVLGAIDVVVSEAGATSATTATALLAAIVFVATMQRVLGAAAATVGTMLAIIAALGTSRHSRDPIADGLWFLLGGGLAVVLSSIVWPVWMHLSVRRAVATVFRRLSDYAAAVDRCWREGAEEDDPRWVDVARVHPRAVREAIEQARATSLAVRVRRSGESRMGSSLRVLLGLADSQFSLLVSLATEVECSPPRSRTEGARAALTSIAERYDALVAILSATAWAPRPPVAAERIAGEKKGAISELAAALSEESAVALSLGGGLDEAEGGESADPPRVKESAALSLDLRLFRDAFTRQSPIFRHAVRTALAAGGAALAGALVSPEHAPWVTVTTITVVQPFTGATVKRAVERVVGTTFGSLVAAAITATVSSALALAAIMFPLSIAAVVTRPRSYRWFTFFLTPLFVLIAMRHPGDFQTAAVRVIDTLAGGGIALVATFAVFPGWEERVGLPAAISAMKSAVIAYADAAVSATAPPQARDAPALSGARRSRDDLRRIAGVAVSDAEASLERFLAEPLRERGREAQAMTLVTYARRLALAATTLDTLVATGGAERAAGTPAAVARVRRFASLLEREERGA